MKRAGSAGAFLLLVLSPLAAVAQQVGTVQGTVVNGTTLEPLAGAQVTIVGTTVGTLTNAQGRFQLPNVATGEQTVRASLIGYGAEESTVSISAGATVTVDFALEQSALQLEGIVVTALGIERQARSLGVATTAVSGENLTRAETNIVNSLSGKVAGVNITNSGPQGGSSRIVIRGENSLKGDNQPLFIVDGIPLDNMNLTPGVNADQGGFDYGNVIQDIDPETIESLTVLKGPNAAALYGSRAANGAIVITTKKGLNALGGVQITANQLVTFEDELRLPRYQNQFGQGFYGEFAYFDGAGGGTYDEYDESWGPPLDTGLELPQFHSPIDPETGERVPLPWVSSPNNVDEFFELGRTLTTNVSVAAANERLHGRFSASRLDQKGMVPGFQLERNTLSFGGGMEATDRLTINASAQYSQASGENRPGVGYGEDNPMSQFVWFGRQVDVRLLRDRYDQRREADDPQAGLPYSWNYSFHPNPYYLQLVNQNVDTRNRLYGQISATYEFTDWLNAMVRTGTDWYQDRRQKNYAEDLFGGFYTTNPRTAAREHVGPTGAFGRWGIGFQETNTDFLVNLTPTLQSPFSVTASFGGNRRDWERSHEYTWVGTLTTPGIYNVANAAIPPDSYVRDFRKRVNSLYGQAELGYNDYLFLTLTGRNDWSSALPEENRSFFYPSVSASFVFSDAFPALQESGLGFGKLRASWSQVGNDTDPYQLISTFEADEIYDGSPSFTFPTELANADLRPEKTTSWEVGTELGFLDNRIGVDLTYYFERTTDQILPVDISRSTGYTRQVLNAGTIENRGWEALLRATPVQTGQFRWETVFTFADNRSKVTELAEGVTGLEIGLGDFWGASVFAREGEPYGQLVGYGFQRNSKGEVIVDANGLPMRTATPIPIGNFNPDWRGSWLNELSYGPVRLNFLLDTRQGGNVYSVTQAFGRYSGVLEETAPLGRCISAAEYADLPQPGPAHRYPVCTAENGIIYDGVRIDSVEGGDTTYVANDIPVSGPDLYTRLFLTPEANVVDASYVKLREMTLSYDLPSRFTDRLNVSGLQVSVIGRNLFLWTPSSNRHIDPETASDGTNVQGYEYGQMPTPRSIGFNITVRP